MSYYGAVWPEFWTGPTGRAIRQQGGRDAQVLALYLLTCRHATMIGLYPLPIADIVHETGLPPRAMIKGFEVLAQVDFATFDSGTEHVWVHEMAKFRLGLARKSPLDADDNKVKGVQNLYDRLLDNPFLEVFHRRYSRELRLKRRRTCGLPVTPLLHLASTKGLVSPLQASKQYVRTQEQVHRKSTGAARRPVENSETAAANGSDPGTFGLYCVIATEGLEASVAQDHDDSIANVAEHFKTLCARRGIAYDNSTATRAIAAAFASREKQERVS